MADSNLFLGQYFFNTSAGNSAGSLNGYTDVDLQLMRDLSTSSGYYFDVHSVYTGFKQVNELAGGGTLFQQSLDDSIGFKWLKRFEDGYSLKPRLGYRNELFRQANNEKWGNGLYDNNRYEAGLALEHKTRWSLSVPWTWQVSYDLYYTQYPHFHSLASSPLGAALGAPNPGDRVLDAITNQLTYRSDLDFPGFVTGYGIYSLALVSYRDAKVVNSQDQYLPANRSDIYQTLGLGANKRLPDWQPLGRVRPVFGLGFIVSDNASNQNNFDTDPAHTQFTAGYYNYWEGHATPNVSLTFLKPMVYVRASYDFAYRGYTARRTQNTNGTYRGNQLQQTTNSVILDASYPLVRNLDLKVRGVYSNSYANTSYQQAYVYNYSSYNYFAGVEWKI